MSGLMYIAWRYLCFHRWKAVLLTVALTLVVFLPAGLTILIDSSAEQLTARARTTPLLAGAAGSPLELTLNGLYFDESRPALTQYAEAEAIAATGLARAIPIYVRYRAGDYRIVGTTPDYQAYRDLKMASGRPVAMLGEAVLGATVARETGLGVGDSIVSSPESAFDLAGVYPLKMQIVGVLKPSLTADDDAVFTDIKTTWVIEGLGHGHQNLQKADASVVMKSDGDTVVANAALVNYNEITPENADSFHFHGDLGAYPVSAIVINPPDQKSGVLLLGRLAGQEGGVQVVRTEDVVEELLATVFRVR
jgi:putative ABC transport system permease protein